MGPLAERSRIILELSHFRPPLPASAQLSVHAWLATAKAVCADAQNRLAESKQSLTKLLERLDSVARFIHGALLSADNYRAAVLSDFRACVRPVPRRVSFVSPVSELFVATHTRGVRGRRRLPGADKSRSAARQLRQAERAKGFSSGLRWSPISFLSSPSPPPSFFRAAAPAHILFQFLERRKKGDTYVRHGEEQ